MCGEALDKEGGKAWNRLMMDDIQSVCRTSWMERKLEMEAVLPHSSPSPRHNLAIHLKANCSSVFFTRQVMRNVRYAETREVRISTEMFHA